MQIELKATVCSLLSVQYHLSDVSKLLVTYLFLKEEIPLRRLKVAISPFSDIFLIDNGPLADSSKVWLILLNCG